jgi:hypothetical protein
VGVTVSDPSGAVANYRICRIEDVPNIPMCRRASPDCLPFGEPRSADLPTPASWPDGCYRDHAQLRGSPVAAAVARASLRALQVSNLEGGPAVAPFRIVFVVGHAAIPQSPHPLCEIALLDQDLGQIAVRVDLLVLAAPRQRRLPVCVGAVNESLEKTFLLPRKGILALRPTRHLS